MSNVITLRTRGIAFDENAKHTEQPDGWVQFHLNGAKVDPFDLAENVRSKVHGPVDAEARAESDKRFNEIMRRRHERGTY